MIITAWKLEEIKETWKEKEFTIDQEFEYVIFLNEKWSQLILLKFDNVLENLVDSLAIINDKLILIDPNSELSPLQKEMQKSSNSFRTPDFGRGVKRREISHAGYKMMHEAKWDSVIKWSHNPSTGDIRTIHEEYKSEEV